jgi:serine/threonine protein kinase
MSEQAQRSLDLRVGTLIDGTYRVERVLGQGAMGVVLQAEDVKLQRQVALKFVTCANPERAEEFYRRFRDEAVGMAALHHPNVVQIFASGEHDGHPFFVMEYVPGNTLRALIRPEQPLHVDVAIGVLRQVCAGLGAVHEQGLVHRDVKPENVLIGPRYRVALTDFGVVEMLRAATSEPGSSGTPHYMAPEVVNQDEIQPQQHHMIDIYALGVLAFELLCGKRPFESDNAWAVMGRHLMDEPPAITSVRPDLPAGFDAVIIRALSKDPTKRWPSCDELFSELQRARLRTAADSSDGPLILVVDDDPNLRMIYRAVFEAAFPEASIESAEDGLVAFELAKARRPDLVVVDLNMPRLDGTELCGVLKGTPELAAAPIVVISSEVTEAKRQELIRIGVSDVRHKPVPPRELVAIARQFLG